MGKTLSIVAFILSFLLPLVGLILGIVALNQAKKDKEALKGLAIAAIVIGGFLTLLVIIMVILVAGMWFTLMGGSNPPLAIAGDKFSIGAPLIAEAMNFQASIDTMLFTIRNGAGEQITITKIKVDECSMNPIVVTSAPSVIDAGEVGSIQYNSPVDCITSQELTSKVSFYYTTETFTTERVATGRIIINPE